MTWNQVRHRRLGSAGFLLLGAVLLLLGSAQAQSEGSDTRQDEWLVHVVLRDRLDGETVAQLEKDLARLEAPRSTFDTIVVECALQAGRPEALASLGEVLSDARERGYRVLGMTADATASPWTALTLVAIGGDLLVEPFRSFRGAVEPTPELSRQAIETLLRSIAGNGEPSAEFEREVTLLAALFDPSISLARTDEGVEIATGAGDARSLLTASGDPLVLTRDEARSLLGMRYLPERDAVGPEVLGLAEGTLLRWVAPENASEFRSTASARDNTPDELTRERSAPIVRIMIDDQIDEATVSLVRRAFAIAREEGAELVVIELETPGGMVVSMNEILDDIDRWRADGRRVVAYVNDEAISAGMVIALGTDEIFMRPGASIGAATPVVMGPGGITAPNDGGRTDSGEKIMSYFRTSVRTLAQKTRPGNKNAQLLAEAMVDPRISLVAYEPTDGEVIIYPKDEYDRLVANDTILPGQGRVVESWDEETLITLTTREAVDFGFATAEVQDFADLERLLGLIPGSSRIIQVETNWSENLVRLLGAYSFLIFLAACVLAYVEFKIPGFGLPGIGSVLCFSILFLREYLGGMAEIPEILLFFAGAALIAVEIFLFPGTVVFGVAGAMCALIGLYLSFHNFTVPENALETQLVQDNLLYFVSALGCVVVFGLLFARYLPSLPFLGRLVSLPSGDTIEVEPTLESLPGDSYSLRHLVGREGVVISDLRPGGRVKVGEEFVDATSEGKYVPRGARVRVSESHGNRVVVVPTEDERVEAPKPRV